MVNLYNITLCSRFSGLNYWNASLLSKQDSTYTTAMRQSTNLLQLHTYKRFLAISIISKNLELLYINGDTVICCLPTDLKQVQTMQLLRYKLRCTTTQHKHNLQSNRHYHSIKVPLHACKQLLFSVSLSTSKF